MPFLILYTRKLFGADSQDISNFLLGGMVFTIHTISMNGVLLEVTTNENRALYTDLSGAGGILPVIWEAR